MSLLKKACGIFLVTLSIACMHCKKKSHTSDDPPPPGSVVIKDSILLQGLSYPWEILWGPDNFIWMTERGGRISRVNPTTGIASTLHTITEVVSNGEGGLLGMVLHPDFATTPHVFIAYNYNNAGNYREKIVRFTYTGAA